MLQLARLLGRTTNISLSEVARAIRHVCILGECPMLRAPGQSMSVPMD